MPLILFYAPGAFSVDADSPLKTRLQKVVQEGYPMVEGMDLSSPDLTREFYARVGNVPVWINEGTLTAHGSALIGILGGAQEHGLDARDYHLLVISARIARGHMADAEGAVDLELLLTDGGLTYARHLSAGKVSPELLYDSWKARPRKQDVVSILGDAISGEARSLILSYEGMAPRDPRYQRLKALLLELTSSIGSPLVRVPRGTLRLDDRGAAVSALRKRLEAWGISLPEVDDPEVFDIALEAGVKQFQHRNGLEPDGIVGTNTIEWLNKSYAQRMRQVRVNMERWRWMPADLGQSRIEVNIAGFRVDVMESDRKVLSMRAIVGKPYHKTPVFSDRMSYLVLNPTWNVPWSIAVNEILPKLKEDSSYLFENNMRTLSGWGYDAKVVDSGSVDWSSLNKQNFRYRFQQMPGDDNALGRVKFIFPNEFDVYLHDTPARSLFTRESRDFSHGCVRLEKPFDLARYLLQDERSWTQERLDAVLESGKETQVPIRSRAPVHLMYWTVWVDDSGLPHFRDDIYKRDEPLAAALIDGQQ